MTSVSIAICTRDRPHHLRDTLEHLGQVRIPSDWDVEVLVIDNSESDSARPIFESIDLSRLAARYIPEHQAGQCFARNRAIHEARGEILLWTDDDVRVPINWIERMCHPIVNDGADAVAGGVVLPPHYDAVLGRLPHTELRSWFASTEHLNLVTPDRLVGANMAFHRRVLSKVPQFDVELGPGGSGATGFGDDTLFTWQLREAGYKIVGCLDVAVEHRFEISRVDRNSLLRTAAKMGRTEAYLFHHWHHQESPHAHVRLAWCLLQRFRIAITERLRGNDQALVSVAILTIEKKLAFQRELIIQARRQRNYARHGLIRLRS